ncbi:MAG TPA: transposase [Anaerolineae bacterium]|nr:transposase [Anaerolineae bacterium]
MDGIKNIRLKDYNYSSNGYYFVTIACHDKNSFLIDLEEIIEEAIKKVGQIDGVVIDYWTAMPDHLHLIISLSNCSLKLGEVVRRLKALVSKEAGFKVWQPNYYEHVVRDKRALEKIRQYIIDNPLAEKIEFEQFYRKTDNTEL